MRVKRLTKEDLKNNMNHSVFIWNVGEALTGYLNEYPCKNFCPDEVQEVVLEIMKECYDMGFDNAIDGVYTELFEYIHGLGDKTDP